MSEQRLNTCVTCGEPAGVKSHTGPVEDRSWPWCFEHMVEESRRLDKERRANEQTICSTVHCGWPALAGGICVRCARVESEALYKKDKLRREAEELAAKQEEATETP